MIHAIEPGPVQTPTVLLIMGSLRAARRCPQITQWVAEIGRRHTDAHYEMVDLADWPLPMDDEPAIPAMGRYAHPHTQAWSEKIASADAVVFVSPQYNWGYPAALKNAIDHLYREWRDKPAAIICYGGHGGGKCAEQLRQIGAALKMRLVAEAAALSLPEDVIRHDRPLDPSVTFRASAESVEQILRALRAMLDPPAAPAGTAAP